MKCPVDHIDMIVVEHHHIELDYCTTCRGVWFDSGELELLLETMGDSKAVSGVLALFTPRETRSPEKKRPCPLCGKKMHKASVCKEPEVLIDACPRGDGIWFDGGELGEVIKQVAGKCNLNFSGVIDFIGEAFKAEHKPHQ